MNTFGVTLSSLIRTHRITITDLADQCDIERTTISKAIKGTRWLSSENVEAIVEVLDLNPTEIKELVDSYINDSMGLQTYNEYVKLLKKFISHSEVSAENKVPVYNSSFVLNSDGSTATFESLSDIVMVAKHLVSVEVGKENGFVYSNFPTGIMLEIMRAFPKSRIDFKHIAVKKKDVDFNNIEFMGDIMDMMSLGYHSSYFHEENNADFDKLLFSYYFITSDKLLLVDFSSLMGIVFLDSKVIDAYTKSFLDKYQNAVKFVSIFEDILALKEQSLKLCNFRHGEVVVSFSSIGCFSTSFLTKDMWDQIARLDLPNREFLIESTYKYYQDVFKEKIAKFIMPKTSLKSFVDNGIVVSMPTEYSVPLSKENRLKVLKSACEYFEKSNVPFNLLREDLMPLDDYMGWEMSSNSSYSTFCLYFIKEDLPLHFAGNISMFFDDKDFVNGMMKFVDCLTLSDYAYTKKESLQILKEEIQRCEMLSK